MHTPGVCRQIARKRSDEAWNDGVIADRADGKHLQTENSASERRPENRRAARAAARHQQHAAFPRIHAEGLAQLVGQRRACLDSCALAPCRSAKQVRHEGADQDERGHPNGNRALGIMHLIQDEVVARLDRRSQVAVHQSDEQTRDRQQGNEPVVCFARVRRPGQRNEQQGGRGATQNASKHRNRYPAQQVAKDQQCFRERT